MPKNQPPKKRRPSHYKRVQQKIEAAQRLNPFIKKHIEKLESENERMKTDPNTTIGQLIPQMRDAISQNKRLSVLAAALIEHNGGSVTLSKTDLESFESKVLNIKWELPEGVTDPTTADSFIFKYEALTQEDLVNKEIPPLNEASVSLGNSILSADVPEDAFIRDNDVSYEDDPTAEMYLETLVSES